MCMSSESVVVLPHPMQTSKVPDSVPLNDRIENLVIIHEQINEILCIKSIISKPDKKFSLTLSDVI